MIRYPATFLLALLFLASCSQRKETAAAERTSYFYPVQKKYTYADYVRNYYKKLVNKDLIGQVQITGDSTATEYFVTYLGNLQINQRKYFVLTQSFSTKDSNGETGHNEILILNTDYENVKTYSSGIENEPPKFIRSNKLIFQDDLYSEWIDFKDEIPDQICLPNGACYY